MALSSLRFLKRSLLWDLPCIFSRTLKPAKVINSWGGGGWRMAALAYLPASVHAVPDSSSSLSWPPLQSPDVKSGLQLCTLPLSSSPPARWLLEAQAVPTHIQLAGAQEKGHFFYLPARKGQFGVSFSGSPWIASSARPVSCSPRQDLSLPHL